MLPSPDPDSPSIYRHGFIAVPDTQAFQTLQHPLLFRKEKPLRPVLAYKPRDGHPDVTLLTDSDGEVPRPVAPDIRNFTNPLIIQYIFDFLHSD